MTSSVYLIGTILGITVYNLKSMNEDEAKEVVHFCLLLTYTNIQSHLAYKQPFSRQRSCNGIRLKHLCTVASINIISLKGDKSAELWKSHHDSDVIASHDKTEWNS